MKRSIVILILTAFLVVACFTMSGSAVTYENFTILAYGIG